MKNIHLPFRLPSSPLSIIGLKQAYALHPLLVNVARHRHASEIRTWFYHVDSRMLLFEGTRVVL